MGEGGGGGGGRTLLLFSFVEGGKTVISAFGEEGLSLTLRPMLLVLKPSPSC